MEWKELDKLIDRYYEGKTSIAEEEQLREMLQSADLPERYQPEAKLMGFYRDQSHAVSSYGAKLYLPDSKHQTRQRSIKLWSIAATVAAVISMGIFYLLPEDNQPRAIVKSQSDPDIAFQSTAGALMMVSDMIRDSKKQVQKINKIDESRKRAIESLRVVSQEKQMDNQNK